MLENAPTVSLESMFLFLLHLASKFWRTSKYLTPFSSFAILSPYVKSIHHISFSNLAKAFIPLILRVARLNFVYEGFKGQNFLTIGTGRLLAFTNMPTDPQAAPSCVFKLCSFWRSFFRGTQLFSSWALALWFRTRAGDIPAASSKVNSMSGKSAIFRRRWCAKTECKTRFYTIQF